MILILGMGLTGLSVARFLSAQNQAFIVADDKQKPTLLNDFIRLKPRQCYCNNLEAINLDSIDQLVLSPGIASNHPFVSQAKIKKITIISDIDLFARQTKTPIVGITGSNGKSTVTHLLTQMLQDQNINAVMCGNVGIAALDALDGTADIYILELSSYQLEIIKNIDLYCAVVLNIAPDHLDRYNNFEHYISTKLKIYQYARHAIIASDEPYLSASETCITYGLELPKTAEQFGTTIRSGSRFFMQGNEVLMPVVSTQLIGLHNVKNILASLTIGYKLGLDVKPMLATAQHFQNIPHRLEQLTYHNDIYYYNDSKATNVSATLSALNAVREKHNHCDDDIVLILGGIAKNEDYQVLAKQAQQDCCQIILIGQSAHYLSSLFPPQKTQQAKTLQEAISKAEQSISQGVILFSPACASFDMFDNFAHRGKVFTQLVCK